jgi:Stigma-specific protein, Stig1
MNKDLRLKLRGAALAVAAFGALGALAAGCSGSDSSSSFATGGKDGGLGGVGNTGGGNTGGVGNTGGGNTGGANTGGAGGANQCPGATLCNGFCVDTKFDPNNCGACGTACQPGEVCSNGQCGVNCSGGTTLCGTSCTNTDTDPANCGACGTACASGEVCSSGQCGLTCTGGTELCGTICTNTQTDISNCGTCGTACASGEVCASGQCGLVCTGGTTKCGTNCVNTDNDPSNCGTCGTACSSGEVCASGVCGLVCAGGTTQCGSNCVNTQTDAANCGGCGNACPSGQVCSTGQCGLTCVGGTTLCNSACVDTNTDPANCGACGTACTVGQVCTAGACASVCGGSLVKCGNNCVDTQTDPANCGACGTKCAPGSNCITGACVACNSATTDCDGDGWLVSEGDCCDKPGVCGSDPALVNPGAIEVAGNGIDDNCNGQIDLFDQTDTLPCDTGLASNSSAAGDYAKALGICRTTTLNPPKASKTWGLITAEILRADGTALGDARARSIRPKFGNSNTPIEGSNMVVISSGIAADGTQTLPGPNGGAPTGGNVSTTHSPASSVNISTCADSRCIKDWLATANPPLKAANQLPVAPNCGQGATGATTANDSVMLHLVLRAPTNARAFSFYSYFMSAEYPEWVCTTFNDQLVALVSTPNGTPSPIPNPVDKNLMTFTDSSFVKWPIGINIAHGTNLFAVCESQATNPTCWDTDVATTSCASGISTLLGTGFDKQTGQNCTIGGGTYWLTTAGNVIPGDIVDLRIVIWDVGDTAYDTDALLDGFKWLPNATLPGTG